MIEISLGTAVLLYGVVIAAGIAVTWLFTEFSADKAYSALEQQDLWRCDFCTFTYLDRSGLNVSRCPRCHSFNARAGVEETPMELVPAGEVPRRRSR